MTNRSQLGIIFVSMLFYDYCVCGSHVWLFAMPWTAAHQAPLSMARIGKWITMTLFRGSFGHRDWAWVSWTEGRFFTVWTTKRLLTKVKNRLCMWGYACVCVGAQWTVAHQAPPSMGFSRQEHWSGLPFSFPGYLPDPGIELRSPTLQAELFTLWATSKSQSEREVAQLYLTLCNPMDCCLPASSIYGIFQARVLVCVAMSSSRRSSRPRDQTRVSQIVGRFFTVWATREVSLENGTPLKGPPHDADGC